MWVIQIYTNLLNAFSEKCGFVTYHGPMVSSNILEHYDDYTRESFLKTIGDWEELEFANDTRPFQTITGGKAEGRLIGGNVTVMGRMMGTFYKPDSNGAIIFLEDVDEHIASLDMYITQMEDAGLFDHAAGILLGDYSGCINKNTGKIMLIDEYLKDRFGQMGESRFWPDFRWDTIRQPEVFQSAPGVRWTQAITRLNL